MKAHILLYALQSIKYYLSKTVSPGRGITRYNSEKSNHEIISTHQLRLRPVEAHQPLPSDAKYSAGRDSTDVVLWQGSSSLVVWAHVPYPGTARRDGGGLIYYL